MFKSDALPPPVELMFKRAYKSLQGLLDSISSVDRPRTMKI